MRIIICMRYANPPAGGAEISMLNLAKLLKEAGNEILVLSLGYKNRTRKFSNIKLIEFKFRPYIKNKIQILKEKEKYNKINKDNTKLENVIRKFKPDLIFTQHEISFLIQKLKQENKLSGRIILFIHGFELLNKKEYKNKRMRKLEEEMEIKLFKLINCVDFIFVPSKYVQRIYFKKFKKRFRILPPFIDVKKFLRYYDYKDRKYILHIKPTKLKGIETTINLAKEIPKESFIICGNKIDKIIEKKIKVFKNIKYIGFKKNMETIYKKTKIFLLPGIYPETFSISAIEAQSAGCKVIALQKGGINAPKSAFIKKLLDKKLLRRRIISGAKLSKKELIKFDKTIQYIKLKTYLNGVLK